MRPASPSPATSPRIPRRSRNSRLVFAGLLLVVLLIPTEDDAATRARRSRRPGAHVLVIVMDTTRADRTGLGGYRRPTTPCLDALARTGVVFRNAWSPSSWTGPSHASLFTGLRPERHGFFMGNRLFLGEESLTLAETLSRSGYRTACYSDNHIVSPNWGLTQGFQSYVPCYLDGPRSESRARAIHEAAGEWATRVHRRGERFFLFINNMEPHLPYTPPPPFEGRFVPEGAPRPVVDAMRRFQSPWHLDYCLRKLDLKPRELSLLQDLYDAEVATLDDSIGRLIEQLRKDGVLDETLVVVTADHGEALGEHHMIGHNLGLDRWLLQVPLLIRFPGAFDGGRIVDDVVRLEDVMPTCLEICGLEVPDGLDARALTRDLSGRVARAILGPPTSLETRRAVEEAKAYRYLHPLRSVFDGRHFLISSSTGDERLYDLRDDPGERVELQARKPDVLRRMRALLTEGKREALSPTVR